MMQSKTVRAYQALNKLASLPMPAQTAHALYKLRKALEPQWEFQAEREQAIVGSLGAKVAPDGTVEFRQPADRVKFAEQMAALAKMDVDVPFARVSVRLADLSAPLTMDDLAALEEFVEVE